MSKQFTLDQISSHKSDDNGIWVLVDRQVYDVTSFADQHPGGKKILIRNAGKDATKQFWKYHSESVLKKYGPKFHIGQLSEKSSL